MNKSSAAWLVVRILGVISIAIACYQLYDFMINFIAVIASSQQELPSNGTLRIVNLRWNPFVGFIFFSLLSVYLLKFGLAVHKLLTAECSTSENS